MLVVLWFCPLGHLWCGDAHADEVGLDTWSVASVTGTPWWVWALAVAVGPLTVVVPYLLVFGHACRWLGVWC